MEHCNALLCWLLSLALGTYSIMSSAQDELYVPRGWMWYRLLRALQIDSRFGSRPSQFSLPSPMEQWFHKGNIRKGPKQRLFMRPLLLYRRNTHSYMVSRRSWKRGAFQKGFNSREHLSSTSSKSASAFIIIVPAKVPGLLQTFLKFRLTMSLCLGY